MPSGYDWYGGTQTGARKAVGTQRPRRSRRWRHIGTRRVRVMKKLGQSKVEYMAAEKRKGTKNQIIAEAMNVTVRYVQKLWARFKHAPEGQIVFPARMGRPPRGPPTKAERSAVLNMRCALKSGANRIWDRIRRSGTAVPKGVARTILREYGEAVEHKRKQARRKWIRYERKYANSMWHTDYKQLDDGRRFISYLDDASRLIV